VPEADLVALYGGAEVMAYPSHFEGFGLPVLEAMQFGTPVLTSDQGALAEIAGGAGLLVDPYDVAAIAVGINALDADAALRDQLGAAGQKATTRFSAEAYARRLEIMYAQIRCTTK